MSSYTPAFPWITLRFAWVLAFVAVLTAAGTFTHVAIDLAIAAGASVVGLFIADVVLGPGKQTVKISRVPIEHLALRKPSHLRYAVENASGTRVNYEIVDTPIDALQFPEAPLTGHAGAGRRAIAELAVIPRLRGPAQLGALYVTITNSVGFIARRWRVRCEKDIRIFPDLSLVERYGELARRGRLIEAGFRKLRLRGKGGEFDSLREWTPDDEFRSINWKATAKRAKLMVEQFDVERSQMVMLVLDAGRLMTPRLGDQRKFDYAITSALSVAYIASLADDKVGLMAFASDVLEHIPPRAGAVHASGMTQRIYDLEPRFEEADYGRAFTYLRRRQPKRSLVIFFTDMFDPVASQATLSNLALLTPRHLAVCVLMNDEAVSQALAVGAQTPAQAYQASVAAQLDMERRKAAAVLAQRGVIVIDVPAKALTVSLINAYVEIKTASLL